MAEGKWGHCKHCRYFASPARVPLDTEEARCTQSELSRYSLKVFSACGCNGFKLRPGVSDADEHPAVMLS